MRYEHCAGRHLAAALAHKYLLYTALKKHKAGSKSSRCVCVEALYMIATW